MLMLEVRINFNDDDHRGNGNYILFWWNDHSFIIDDVELYSWKGSITF
jgi:hypothetical protein